ncbi:MAG: hypothetical protein IPM82_16560 [Saprospiraceae bacterium]|nr:hypothetical protein [Saprospiraceae bacterium]
MTSSAKIVGGGFSGETDQNSYVTSQVGILGLTHRLLLNETTYLRTTIAASNSGNTYNEERVLEDQSIRTPLGGRTT